MARNSILDELHTARQKIFSDYDGDTAAYLRDAGARLEASGRAIARRAQRTIRRISSAESRESVTERPSSCSAD